MAIPIIINCRDRLTPLLELLAWLGRARHDRIYLLDNDSTYPPLLDYYERTPHEVIRLGRNGGAYSPWRSGLVERLCRDTYYAVTDPDIVPIRECPLDAIDRFRQLLERYPDAVKVGFGLKIDDLPNRYRFAAHVCAWERRFWSDPVAPGVYRAAIDTTFALYRPAAPFAQYPALRTGGAYVARHLPWYIDSAQPGEEEGFYRRRLLPDVSTWNGDDLPAYLVQELRLSPDLARPAGHE
jgi:hypothetical protein